MEMKETFLLSLYCPLGKELNSFRNVLSAEWSDLGELRFNMAVTFISNKDFKCGLGHLGKMYRMVEETKRFAGKNTAAAAAECNEVTVLESDYNTCLAMGQSLQAMHVGEDMVKHAVEDEESVNYDLVWDALDKFKEAELLSKGEDVELLCMALFHQGRVYDKVLLNKLTAKLYLKEALDLSQTLVTGPYRGKWYIDLTSLIENIRSQELLKEEQSWQNQRIEHLKKVQTDIDEIEQRKNSKLTELCDYLFEKHPPRHHKDYQGRDSSNSYQDLIRISLHMSKTCLFST
jgi:hypothetical protein